MLIGGVLAAARRSAKMTRRLGVFRLFITILLLALALLIARYSWHLLFVQDAEGILYDVRSALTAPAVDQDNRIVMVVYDDDTLIQTGKRSPLDRAILAKALRRIDTMHAKAIGIDILIDQPQPEDPALIAAFRSMKTPTWLAYAAHASASDKINDAQQTFIEQVLASAAPGNVHATSIRLEADQGNFLRRWPSRIAGLAKKPCSSGKAAWARS